MCSVLWRKVKSSDRAVDSTFVGITVLASGITVTVSSTTQRFENLFACVGICAAIYALVRALTGRLRIVTAKENVRKHQPANVLVYAVMLFAAGLCLCFSEYGLHGDFYETIKFRVIAPCALALGLCNIGLGLVKPSRLSNLVFCVSNATACAMGALTAWEDCGKMSIARDSYYNTFFSDNELFIDVSTTIPITLRLLCPTVISATTLLTSLILASSIVTFQRKHEETKVIKTEMTFPKLIVGICGLMMLLVTFYKIWNVTHALLMPGPMDVQSTRETIAVASCINYHAAVLTALMAVSCMYTRDSGMLKVLVLMSMAGVSFASDYVVLTQYNPDVSLNRWTRS